MTVTGPGDEQCCVVPVPVERGGYVPNGRMIRQPVGGREDMMVYVIGSEELSERGKALICVYDIFGIHPSTLRGVDFLSSLLGPDVQIYVPDIFRGKGWKTDNIPPREGRAAMQAYIQEIGCWDGVRDDLLALVANLQQRSVVDIGAFGFCFGGKKLAQAASDSQTRTLFDAIALIHPTNLLPSDGELFSVPVALLPSGGEDPEVMDAIWEKVRAKEGSMRKDFLDCKHGFASARSQWDEEPQARRVREVYEMLGEFFKRSL